MRKVVNTDLCVFKKKFVVTSESLIVINKNRSTSIEFDEVL